MSVTASDADALVGALAQFLPRYFDRASGPLRQELLALRDAQDDAAKLRTQLAAQAEAMTRQAVVIEQLSQRLTALESRPEPAQRDINYERLEAAFAQATKAQPSLTLADMAALVQHRPAVDEAALQARCLEAVDVKVREAVAALPPPQDGKDADMEALRRDLASMVAALPKPKNGKDGRDGWDGADGRAGVDGAKGADGKDGRDGLDGADGRAGADGKDGRDADMETLKAEVARLVADAVAALPKPQNGKDGRDGVDGKDGKDGAGIKDAVVDAQGTLHLTLADGRMLKAEGLRGQDGLGFEDLTIERKSERVINLVFRRDGREKRFELTFPVPIYRGVHQDQAPYQQGDMVTKDGAMWVAMSDLDGSEGRPGASPAWKLAVKRGPAARTASR